MRRFYFGPSSEISTDSLYFTQVRGYSPPCYGSDRPPILSLFSIEATVCSSSLGIYIRTQDIVILGKWDDLLFRNGSISIVDSRYIVGSRSTCCISPIGWNRRIFLPDIKDCEHYERCQKYEKRNHKLESCSCLQSSFLLLQRIQKLISPTGIVLQ